MSDEKLTNNLKDIELPKLAEIRKGLINGVDDKEELIREFALKSPDRELEFIHKKGIQDHYKHKEIWSFLIMAIMAILLVFQCVLLGLVGQGIWSFEKYSWLLPALLVQNFAQIVGLAVFVVKALFRDIRPN